jgi:hypothetical protein
MHTSEICFPQPEIGIGKMNYTVKSPWSSQNGWVQDGRFVCSRDDNDALAGTDTIQAIEELLKVDPALGKPGGMSAEAISGRNRLTALDVAPGLLEQARIFSIPI